MVVDLILYLVTVVGLRTPKKGSGSTKDRRSSLVLELKNLLLGERKKKKKLKSWTQLRICDTNTTIY